MTQLLRVVEAGGVWNESTQRQFELDNYEQIELPWQTAITSYPVTPQNDSIAVACQAYLKWNMFGETSCSPAV